jgi:RNA polymerase primary sigma factor
MEKNIIDQDGLKKYIKLIRKKKLLSSIEQQQIIDQLKITTDITEKKKLQEKLIESNLRYVITVARKYQNKDVDIMDLISEGNIGLLKAIEKYDLYSNIKFITYAVFWIRQSILAFLNEYGRTIRLPTNIIQDSIKQKREEEFVNSDIYNNETTTFPYCVDIADEFVKEKWNFEDTNNFIDNILIEENNFDEDNKAIIRNLLKTLDDRERVVIEKYYGFNEIQYSLDDLGEEFNCTKERIRQLKDKAIKKLRNESLKLFNEL